MESHRFGRWEYTDEELACQIKRAEAASRATRAHPAAIVGAEYRQAPFDHLAVKTRSGVHYLLPIGVIRELAGASVEELARVEVSPLQDALRWPDLDVFIDFRGLLADVSGLLDPATAGRAGGASRSPAKSDAARENGKKGGRPRKAAPGG